MTSEILQPIKSCKNFIQNVYAVVLANIKYITYIESTVSENIILLNKEYME